MHQINDLFAYVFLKHFYYKLVVGLQMYANFGKPKGK